MINDILIILWKVSEDMFLSFWVAVGFAALFNVPFRILAVAGLLGSFGHGLRFILLEWGHQGPILSSLLGCLLIGFLGIYMAHKVHVPPVIFTTPACITMIPGLFAYRSMLGFIKISNPKTYKDDPSILLETFHNIALTSSLLLCLAVGLSLAILVFRKHSVKTISVNKEISARLTQLKKKKKTHPPKGHAF